MPNYKYGDDAEYFTTYGHLREWAEDCDEVKNWIKQHIPEALEKQQIQFKPRHFYRIGASGGIYLLSYVGHNILQLVCVAEAVVGTYSRVGNRWGGAPGDIDFIQNEYGSDIIEDLGPDWLKNQLARKEKEDVPL